MVTVDLKAEIKTNQTKMLKYKNIILNIVVYVYCVMIREDFSSVYF